MYRHIERTLAGICGVGLENADSLNESENIVIALRIVFLAHIIEYGTELSLVLNSHCGVCYRLAAHHGRFDIVLVKLLESDKSADSADEIYRLCAGLFKYLVSEISRKVCADIGVLAEKRLGMRSEVYHPDFTASVLGNKAESCYIFRIDFGQTGVTLNLFRFLLAVIKVALSAVVVSVDNDLLDFLTEHLHIFLVASASRKGTPEADSVDARVVMYAHNIN